MKPTILAVDASALEASVALVGAEDRLLGHWRQAAGERGTAAVAPAIQRLLGEAGLRVGDLGGVVVGTGPGSFTGLRSAIALVRALAHAAPLACVGVESFAMVARAALLGDGATASAAERVVVWLDARRAQAYRADYARSASGELETLAAPHLVPIEEVSALRGSDTQLVVRDAVPDAYHGAVLGRRRLAAGGEDPSTILPLYLKRSHAEIALEERRRKA